MIPLPDTAELLASCPPSVPALLDERVAAGPDRPAFLVPHDRPDGSAEWTTVAYGDFRHETQVMAAGLLELGVEPADVVSISSDTRYEWIVAAVATSYAGAVVSSIYPNSSDKDAAFVLNDSCAAVLIAENRTQLAKVRLHDDELGGVPRHIVLLDDDRDQVDRADPRVLTWADLRARGEARLAAEPDCVTARAQRLGPDDLAALLYTSGTTGRSRGVELTHGAMVFQGISLRAIGHITEDDVHYLWLPLSHSFGNFLLVAQWAMGCCTAVDGRSDRIMRGLAETRPTIMNSVPRVLEKVRAEVLAGARGGGAKARLTRWALEVAAEATPYRQSGTPMPGGLARRFAMADRMVLSKLREALGGRMRYVMCGGAKVAPEVVEWFYGIGVPIAEGYGSTETTISFLSRPWAPKFGSIGPPNPGVEARIADDGELMLRSPSLLRAYHGLPEKTAAAFTDGWYHTGDMGEMDADGEVYLTDRKKDLFKTSAGKYVSPQRVENAITATVPLVGQVVAVGDGERYVAALITLDPAEVAKWAAQHGYQGEPFAELARLPEVRDEIERGLQRTNARLEPGEAVHRFAILDHEFAVDEGAITPSRKVRRAVIGQRYADLISSLYDERT